MARLALCRRITGTYLHQPFSQTHLLHTEAEVAEGTVWASMIAVSLADAVDRSEDKDMLSVRRLALKMALAVPMMRQRPMVMPLKAVTVRAVHQEEDGVDVAAEATLEARVAAVQVKPAKPLHLDQLPLQCCERSIKSAG